MPENTVTFQFYHFANATQAILPEFQNFQELTRDQVYDLIERSLEPDSGFNIALVKSVNKNKVTVYTDTRGFQQR